MYKIEVKIWPDKRRGKRYELTNCPKCKKEIGLRSYEWEECVHCKAKLSITEVLQK